MSLQVYVNTCITLELQIPSTFRMELVHTKDGHIGLYIWITYDCSPHEESMSSALARDLDSSSNTLKDVVEPR